MNYLPFYFQIGGVGKTRDGRTSVTVKMGKTRDRTVRDIYVTDPCQISVRMDRLQKAIIRDGWRLIFSLKNKAFPEIRDGLAIIRDGWRLIFSLKT